MSVNINDIYNIAYNVCYSIRSSKASDAETECSAYASCVASNDNYKDADSIKTCCDNNVLDPWGTDIFLGWLGQLFAPNAMPSPDCPTIATITYEKIQYYIEQLEQGMSSEEALMNALNTTTPTESLQETLNELMQFMMVMPVIQMFSVSMTHSQGSNVLTQLVGLIPLFIIMSIL